MFDGGNEHFAHFSQVNFENGGGSSTVTDDCIIGDLKVMYQSKYKSTN